MFVDDSFASPSVTDSSAVALSLSTDGRSPPLVADDVCELDSTDAEPPLASEADDDEEELPDDPSSADAAAIGPIASSAAAIPDDATIRRVRRSLLVEDFVTMLFRLSHSDSRAAKQLSDGSDSQPITGHPHWTGRVWQHRKVVQSVYAPHRSNNASEAIQPIG